MTDFIPPAPPFSVSRWLTGVAVTTAVIGGIIGGLLVLFIPEGVFDMGPDKTDRAQEEANLQEVHGRLARLEKQLRENTARVENVAATPAAAPQEIETLREDTSHLKEQMAALQNNTQNEGKNSALLIGLTQLQNAHDNDQSLQAGIAVLKQNIQDARIQADLARLEEIAANNMPTRQAILAQLQKLKATAEPAPKKLDDKDLTWQERGKIAMSRFVTIKPTQSIASGKTLEKVEQAISASQFGEAVRLIDALPVTAETSVLKTQLAARAQADALVKNTIARVSGALGQQKGSLY